MSSTFPTSIDSFANPTSTKINGTDYVKAQHVNDLQDAVRAIEICMTGSGLNMKIASNNYIPESASVKFALEIADTTMKMIYDALTVHHDSMAITDPVQHHANVIEVASGTSAIFADIQPRRAQTVLEVIRTEITRMLNGDSVRGKNLSDLYATKEGPALFKSTMQIDGETTINNNVFLGTSPAHKASVAGELAVLGLATFGDVLISGTDVILPSNGRSGLKNSLNYSYTLYNDQRTEIGSKKDIVLRLDRDALVNPSSLVSSFQILNASDNKVFEVTDTGEASVAGGLLVQSLSAKTEIKVGEGESSLVATPNDITTYANNFHLAIDKEGLAPLASFNVTSGGYKGIDPSNENVILQATNEKLASGTTYLKPGLIEDGEFGFKFFSRNPGGEFHGYFVPFRQLKTSIPSVVFVVDSDTSVNVNTVQVAYATTSGFFIECDSITTGSVMLRGRYEA